MHTPHHFELLYWELTHFDCIVSQLDEYSAHRFLFCLELNTSWILHSLAWAIALASLHNDVIPKWLLLRNLNNYYYIINMDRGELSLSLPLFGGGVWDETRLAARLQLVATWCDPLHGLRNWNNPCSARTCPVLQAPVPTLLKVHVTQRVRVAFIDLDVLISDDV